jgi:ubiquinone/menaquinone biosynthesis C-methylase UbiE
VSFDRIAPHYRWLETLVFGNQLQEARLAFLRGIESPRRVLIVGEGNGRFLAEFVRAHPGAVVDCVEASARMIELGRGRLKNESLVHFIQADIGELKLVPNSYDLIVTHFFLDCFVGTALREVVRKLACAATDDANWLLADFRVPASGWQNFHARLWIRAMYCFFRLTSGLQAQHLDDSSPLLKDVGFKCVRPQLTRFGMIKSELWRRSA